MKKPAHLRSEHTFKIPVMGTAFSIDTPLKVAKFGISSVVSLCDDELCEQLRQHYSKVYQKLYAPITKKDEDYRAKRFTAYLNLLDELVKAQIKDIKSMPFDQLNDLTTYFELLPADSEIKKLFREMQSVSCQQTKINLQNKLKDSIVAGDIEVNIMTKLDRDAYDKNGVKKDPIYSDALAGLRGFANSNVKGNIVFSAGFNRRLYAYINSFSDFFMNKFMQINKKVVVKVSDFRSAYTQGKFLAKKGIWVSEYRIESGLNCGGHAFATTGFLLGPILEEFKKGLTDLKSELYALYTSALKKMDQFVPDMIPESVFTVQGGVGTHHEHDFLCDYYQADAVGWGTPFLLVPEVTNVDEATLKKLQMAGSKDLYLSDISPLGVPFNALRGTASELQKQERIANGKPGSPCPKGHLVSTLETTENLKNAVPVCKAAKFYQVNKIKKLEKEILDKDKLQKAIKKVVAKACLCEDLAASVQLIKGIISKRPLKTAICPGPNMAYFSKIASLSEMVSHIYGRVNLMTVKNRSHFFVNELNLYIHYFKKEIDRILQENLNDWVYLQSFKQNLFKGIDYYIHLVPQLYNETQQFKDNMLQEIKMAKNELNLLVDKYSFLQPDVQIA